jgi:hypothetical protein
MGKDRKRIGERAKGYRYIKGRLREYHGCEVCWTCLYYHIRYFRCNIPVPDGKSISQYAGNKIKNPEWFRCNHWWPKDEGWPEDE